MTTIKQAIPNNLEGVALQTTTMFGAEVTPKDLCQYLLESRSSITLYVSLNSMAYDLLTVGVNC